MALHRLGEEIGEVLGGLIPGRDERAGRKENLFHRRWESVLVKRYVCIVPHFQPMREIRAWMLV